MEGVDELLIKTDEIIEQNKELLKILESMKNMNNIKKDGQEFKNKRNIYIKKLNNNEIKEPKEQTMKYYDVKKDDEGKYY